MANMEHYRRILAAAAEQLGFENVKPDEQGNCTLQFEDTFVSFSCQEESSQASLVIPVAEVPGECPREVMELLLDAQLFFKDTRGGTFSFDKTNGWVLLHLNLMADAIDESMLCNAIENMLDVARTFGEKIGEMLAGGETAKKSPQEAEGDFPVAGGIAV